MNGEENIKSKRKGPSSRWGILALALLLACGTALSILSLKWRSTLRIQHIVVDGANALSVKDIVAMTKISARAPLYALNLVEIRDRIARHPFVLSAYVYRQFPNSVEIDVVERVPVAAVNCGQLCYTDRDGILLPYSESNKKFDLPLVSGIDGLQNAKPGAALMSKELQKAIELCQTAQALDTSIYHMISEVNMNNGGDIILYSSESGVPVIVGRDDIARKLLMFENFWSANVHPEDVEDMKYIDLRFRDQVVVKWAQQQAQQTKKASS